jgi:hypothetical protein
MTRFLLLSDYYGVVDVGRPLWRENGSDVAVAAGPCQRSYFRAGVPWDLWPYFTVSDSRLPFSSPPTTRRATVEVFYPYSTRSSTSILLEFCFWLYLSVWLYSRHRLHGFYSPVSMGINFSTIPINSCRGNLFTFLLVAVGIILLSLL